MDAHPQRDLRAAVPERMPAALRRRAPAPSTRGVDGVALIADPVRFADLRHQWDALVERCDDQAFYRHRFVQTWLAHFAPAAELRVLARFERGGRLTAVLPLVAESSRLCGLPVREWRAAANDHSCRFDLIADRPAEAASAFVEFLRTRRDWDLLRLIDVPLDGGGLHLQQAAGRAGLAIGCWDSQQSPYVELRPSWDEFEASLRKRFRGSLRRRRRRLESLGQVSVERVTGGPHLLERLEEGLALEMRGWKGRAGTAIAQDTATYGFYRTLARQAAANRQLALWFLRLDGEAIAFDFTIEHAGRLLLLKTAYDERYAKCSPGQLLTEVELRDAHARGLRECDFLGSVSAAKLDWTDRLRPHGWIYVFRGSRGRLAHLLKFRFAPSLKRWSSRGDEPSPVAGEAVTH